MWGLCSAWCWNHQLSSGKCTVQGTEILWQVYCPRYWNPLASVLSKVLKSSGKCTVQGTEILWQVYCPRYWNHLASALSKVLKFWFALVVIALSMVLKSWYNTARWLPSTQTLTYFRFFSECISIYICPGLCLYIYPRLFLTVPFSVF